MMIVSNVAIIVLAVYCFYRVLTTKDAEQTEHAPLDIDTRDREES